MKRLKAFLCVGFAVGAVSAAYPAEVAVVEDARAKLSLVVPEDAPTCWKYAAGEFARWTKEVTGVELPVGAKPVSGLTPFSCRFLPPGDTSVRFDGFRLSRTEAGVVLSVRETDAVLFGVYYLLSRYAGIRWYHPESGADFRPRRDFRLPASLVKTPMARRQAPQSGNGPLATPERRRLVAEWLPRVGCRLQGGYYAPTDLERLGVSRVVSAGGHCLGELVLATPVDSKELDAELRRVQTEDRGKFKKALPGNLKDYAKWNILVRRHPDWFGLVDGERLPAGVGLRPGDDYVGGKTAMPCLTNPEVRKIMLANFRRWRKTQGHCRIAYDLICDDHFQWCTCDRCAALMKSRGGQKGGTGAVSDYWWDFVNWMGGQMLEDPDVELGVYLYHNYRDYPERVKPIVRDRMHVVYCTHGRCYLHSLRDSACHENAPFREALASWSSVGMPLDTFEYMQQTSGASNYAFWENAWVDDVRHFMKESVSVAAGGLTGVWYGSIGEDDYFRRNSAKARWQIAWLTSHFAWDPDDDPVAVREAMYADYYERAWPAMRRYHDLLERTMREIGLCMFYGAHNQLFETAAFTPGVLDKAEALLAEACAAAKDDPVVCGRLAWDEEYFRTNWRAAMPTNVLRNASFETAAAKPVPATYNALNWTVLSDDLPNDWTFLRDGGTVSLASDRAPDGRRHLRVRAPAKTPSYVMANLLPYPKSARRLRIRFLARGQGELAWIFRVCDRKATRSLKPLRTFRVASADWQTFEGFFEVPAGQVPDNLLVRFSGGPVEIDACELLPVAEAAPKTEVMFFFDSEDYTCDHANDAIRDEAKLLTEEGVRGHFAIVGYLADRLQHYGRQDVIDALKPHVIGTQSLYHSLHPNIMEKSDVADYAAAYRAVFDDESRGLELIRRATGRDRLMCAVPPGDSKSYVAMYAYADLGIPFYCDTVVDDRKGGDYAYCNLRHIPYSHAFMPETMMPAKCNAEPDYAAALDAIASERRVILFMHPNMALYREFWDAVNYNRTNLVAFGQWKPSRPVPLAETSAYYRRLRQLIRELKADPRFVFTDLDRLQAEELPRTPIRRSDVPQIRKALLRELAPVDRPSWSVADMFLAAVGFLKGEKEYLPGKVYGFLDKPVGIRKPTTVTREEVIAAARKLKTDGFLPTSLSVGSATLGPADFLLAALAVLDGEEAVRLEPREQLGNLSKLPPLERFSPRGKWIYTPEYEDRYTSDRLRWQFWTLRKIETKHNKGDQ